MDDLRGRLSSYECIKICAQSVNRVKYTLKVYYVPVAQLDRARRCGRRGRRFKSFRARKYRSRSSENGSQIRIPVVRLRSGDNFVLISDFRLWRVRIVDNYTSFENSREQSLHRFESCTLRFHLAGVAG